MEDFIQNLILASLLTYGIRSLFSHPNLLHSLYQWLEPRVNEYILKPTFGCYRCMASFWGLVYFFLVMFPEWPWYYVFLFCLCLCGVNSLVDDIIN